MFTLIVVWIGSDLLLSFDVASSYFDLAVVFFYGMFQPDRHGAGSGIPWRQRGIHQRRSEFYFLARDVPVGSLVFHRRRPPMGQMGRRHIHPDLPADCRTKDHE